MNDINPSQPPAGGSTSSTLNPKLTGKHFLAIGAVGLVALMGWLGYSHHKAILQAQEAYYNAEETLQLPASNAGNTSFKDIESSFRNLCAQNNQRVSVKSIELACTAQELTHQVDDRISGGDVEGAVAHGETLNHQDIAAINRYNTYARHGTYSEGFDINWVVNVSITHRVRRSSNSTTPPTVEWLCPDPTSASRLPIRPSNNLPMFALTKYGIQFTHIRWEDIRDGNGGGDWEAMGVIGTNKFQLTTACVGEYLNPSEHYTPLHDSPIIYLEWNDKVIHPPDSFKGIYSDNPVLNQPEIKTLAAWALDYYSSKIAAEKKEAFEVTAPIQWGKHVGIGNTSVILVGPVFRHMQVDESGTYKIKGQKLLGWGNWVLVESITKSTN